MNMKFALLLTTAIALGVVSLDTVKAQEFPQLSKDVMTSENDGGGFSFTYHKQPGFVSLGGPTNTLKIEDSTSSRGKFVGGVTEHQTTPDRGVPMAKVAAHSR